jgi:hypothetical protein
MPDDRTYGFKTKDAARVSATVLRDERRSQNDLGDQPKGRGAYLPGLLFPAKTKSGGITAGSLTSPSTNSVTLLVPGSGSALASGADVNVLNYSTRTVTGANKLIFVGWFNGKRVIPLGDC